MICGLRVRLRLLAALTDRAPRRDRFGPALRRVSPGLPDSNLWTPGSRVPIRMRLWLRPATSPSGRPRRMRAGAEYQRVYVQP
jgi:hypothetical protein